MGETNVFKVRWHAVIIAVIVLTLSIISWVQFAKEANGIFSEQDSSSEDPAEAAKLEAFCNAIDEFLGEVDSKWSVYKKKELSKIDSLITYYGMREVASVQVFAGKDKWLFYKTTTDGDPIADYEGTNLFTQEQLERRTKSSLSAQKKLAKKGIKLAIVIAPNKENIYWEYMPETYVRAETTRTDQLVEYMNEKGVNAVSPKKELLDEHLVMPLYYYYDTHWNQLGAYICAGKTLASWNLTMPALSERTITPKPLKGNYHYHGQDDLANILDMRNVFSDETEYEIEGTVPMDWETYGSEQSKGILSHFYNENAVNHAGILILGDSFRSAMIPALREQFTDVYVSSRKEFDYQIMDQIDPDYVIVEYAERYSGSISNIKYLFK